MQFKPLDVEEQKRMRQALEANVSGAAIRLSQRNTQFIGFDDAETALDQEVVNAIRSVPTHYANLPIQVQRSAAREYVARIVGFHQTYFFRA